MALTLTTSWQAFNQGDFVADGGSFWCHTKQYAYYEKINSSTARVHIKQVVWADGTWYGTNNYYRTRDVDSARIDSGYNKYASGFGSGETTVYEGYYDITSSSEVSIICYFATYGGTYYTDHTTAIKVPSSAFYSAPSNPTISDVSTTTTTLTGTLNLSSWGNPSSGRFEYYFGTTSDTTSDYTLSPTSGYSSSKTASINKTGLTTNQHYYVRYRVWNQQLNNPSGLILGGAYITKPAASTNHTVDNVEMTSVRINWSIPADGGHYDKKYYYSLDNGSTWVLAKTYSGGSAGTGDCTISGLSPCTGYTAKFKVTTTAGTTNCPDFTIKTSGGLYGSVAGKTKKIIKLYGSVAGKTKEIKKLYASVNGVTKRIF